ncbi:golgi matrix protein [Ophiocordyceps camponoti-floridani]|uniref:Golgi matrix protein n=1 Tax=Ophiocordyceps camponoti-floridani TaxID=2030778 RepID=A0A8H4Q6J1_9HYPO|nr:golgi matrix protein [Ophiocordyceps camponoti-floridani]
MASTPGSKPATAPQSPTKKKASKKKKNANQKKEAVPTANGETQHENEGQDDSESLGEADKDPGNGHAPGGRIVPTVDEGTDPTAKLDAMGKEREALRAEVAQLRRQLESIQESHEQDVSQLRSDLEESTTAKEKAEEQYQNLLGRVEKIKESLGDRLRRDKAELEEARERIEELEAQNEELQGSARSSGEDADKLREELQAATRELTTLRSRNNLSAHNWLREKEELSRTVQNLKEEMETTSTAMGEWEVLAMEERSIKDSLVDKVSELEEQMLVLKGGYESASAERDSQTTLIENLQNALREIQEARKKELRDMVETTEAQLRSQKQLLQEALTRRDEAEKAKEDLSKELARTAPFEKEVKEKNLLIGKLRHEAIVLNDHLTKALRFLKRMKPEDNVDRQVVTNHFLHFLTLDRGDAKRFQVLQVIAGYLNWTDEQREQAGLARPGASSGSLRLPPSPFHRTPSSPWLGPDMFSEPPSARDKESLAELWAGFLERSAREGAGEAPASSRKDSLGSAATGTGHSESGAS